MRPRHGSRGPGDGGGTLSELYSSSKRLLLKTRDALERLEHLEYTSSSSSSSFSPSNGFVSGASDDQSTAIRRDIIQIQSLCSDMNRLWRSIAAKSQRGLWKRKVEQMAEEADKPPVMANLSRGTLAPRLGDEPQSPTSSSIRSSSSGSKSISSLNKKRTRGSDFIFRR